MVNKYLEMQKEFDKEFEKFPIFFAFSEEQFDEGLKKLNTTKDNVASTMGGGFIRKEDRLKWIEMWERRNKKYEEAMKDDDFVYQMFRYELNNHEYCITYDYTDTLESLGLKYGELDDRMLKLLLKAKEDYMQSWEDYQNRMEEENDI